MCLKVNLVRAVLFSFCCLAASAFADDKSFRFGGALYEGQFKVDDPSGPTSTTNSAAWGLLATYEINRNGRFVASLSRDSYKLSGSVSNVGQSVIATTTSISYQKNIRFTRDFKPWFGAGIGYASSKYSDRFTCNNAACSFGIPKSNTNDSTVVYLLNANAEWPIDQDFDFGFQVQYMGAMSSKTSSIRAGLYILY